MIQSQVTITYQSQFVVMPVLAGYLSEHVCSAIMQITPDDRRSVAKAKGNLNGVDAIRCLQTSIGVNDKASRRCPVYDAATGPFVILGRDDTLGISHRCQSRGPQQLPQLPTLIVARRMRDAVAISLSLVQG